MSHLVAFAGSNSTQSINFKLVKHTASRIKDHEVRLLDMSQITLPVFSEDLEREEGYAPILKELLDKIKQANGLIISVNEHNRNPSAFFKNLIDWLSRVDKEFLNGTKILLMSSSRGRGGALGSQEVANKLLSRFGGEIVATFSLPSFNHTFSEMEGITDLELKEVHDTALQSFLSKI
ncbi:FMN-dependent NADH-azoreductase [Arenibacter antarcticus]|uniref:NADPH-dependent FMN reductase n=1 Tax=Arenibacter antarcticus TaxID=2040469 RepID=A0ABW5VIW2_9FLAO|nr:NAD(P)H-dependent oxidoreductase [Arenibacter sp. H213]MCM4166453.1 NADPH-dependent FMN reductase [Arenibacter sp. H213]